jgi:hypothetical protein
MTHIDQPPRAASNVVPFPAAATVCAGARLIRLEVEAQIALQHQIDRRARRMAEDARITEALAEAADLAARTVAHARSRRHRSTRARIGGMHFAGNLACAAVTALLVLLIVYDTPARLAATVLQAEQVGGW